MKSSALQCMPIGSERGSWTTSLRLSVHVVYTMRCQEDQLPHLVSSLATVQSRDAPDVLDVR
jgi:hypothetical protein